MPRTPTRLASILALALLALLSLLSSRASGAPLLTGFLDEDALYTGSDGPQALANARAAGASTLRIIVYWREVAPTSPTGAFVPTNPADPQYDWSEVDVAVQRAKDAGLEPILDFARAPDWASQPGGARAGTVRPDAAKFGQFATAAATRYSGTFPTPANPLPRVKYWQAWNEPNYPWFLSPQYDSTGAVGAEIYRGLVNAFGHAVHAVPGNIVIAGGTAPRGFPPASARAMAFARNVLCVTPSYKSACSKKVEFDVWATHPYTWGGPTGKAPTKDWIYLGDLPALRRLLNAATNLHKVVDVLGHSKSRVDLWVTEFSWDTDRPDPAAVAQKLQTRWTSEALYQMWRSSVRQVTWFTIRDRPFTTTPGLGSRWQSGMYYCGTLDDADGTGQMCQHNVSADVPKPSLTAFKFPFVAYAGHGKVSVWGRTPPGAIGKVSIQRRRRAYGAWSTVARLTPSSGIFSWRQSTSWTKGYYRAVIGGAPSVPFSLRRPATPSGVNPFGCGDDFPC